MTKMLKNLICGAGTVIALHPDPATFPRSQKISELANHSTTDNLRQDWRNVGNYIKNASINLTSPHAKADE